MGKAKDGSTKIYLVDNSASQAMPAAVDLGYFFHLWTVFGEEDAALMPGVRIIGDIFEKFSKNMSNPFFGRSSYPSLAIRRTIAAEYLQSWNQTADVSTCDALIWAAEIEGTGLRNSHCIHLLQ